MSETTNIRRTAHDSGDGATVRHCFSCGGGQVVGRSDGTCECQYCSICFTVQVQPAYSGFPQSVGGAPFPIPGMPGQIGGGTPPMMDAPGGDPGASPFGGDPEADPAADGGGNPFADGGDPDAAADDEGHSGGDGDPDGGNPFAKKKDTKKKSSSLRQPARYATATGARLSPEAFAEYLAIRHAVNAELDPLLERLRASRHRG